MTKISMPSLLAESRPAGYYKSQRALLHRGLSAQRAVIRSKAMTARSVARSIWRRIQSGRAGQAGGIAPVGGFAGQAVSPLVGQVAGEVEQADQQLAGIVGGVVSGNGLRHRAGKMPLLENGGGGLVAGQAEGVFFPTDEGQVSVGRNGATGACSSAIVASASLPMERNRPAE